MSERMITANGVELCTEAFGDPSNPALVLVMGACASMLRWEEEFCERLAAGGRHVIRYDNRDVGRSTTYEPGTVPYTIEDLADDAVGILDAYGIERAHFAGASMGGMICQQVALRRPERVLTITPIISTPDPSSIFAAPAASPEVQAGTAAVDSPTQVQPAPPTGPLPGPTAEVLAAIAGLADLDWSDEAATVEAQVKMFALLDGPRFHDPVETRALFEREFRRASNLQSSQNHAIAVATTPRWRDRLGDIGVPTLVIYGTRDPILPPAHSIALAKEIAGASLMAMEDAGHGLPRAAWDDVVTAILAHTDG